MYIFIWLLKKAFFFFFFLLPATEPPKRKVAHLFPDFFVHLCIQLVPATHFLTDLEKARQTKARSKKPVPRTWRVLRLTESHTRTWGASSCRGRENILFLTQLEHNSGKNASYFLLFMTAVVKKKLKIKMSTSSTYFAIGGSAGCLTCGYSDFVRVDSQAGEEEAHMKFLLNIKKGTWIKMSNVLVRTWKAAFDDERRLVQWMWNPPAPPVLMHRVFWGGVKRCRIETSALG